MSNAMAIAAVTATLRKILTDHIQADPALSDATVTTQPPDKARGNNNANQLNVFLYQTAVNAAWRNTSPPAQRRAGEQGNPPLALTLYYLLTAYGRDNDDVQSHHLISRAMSAFHDHQVLGDEEIRSALPGNDLHEQIERVRITPQPLTLEELSKLWMIFQSQYRISAAYRLDVVLIDSTHPVSSPLPVISRGTDIVAARFPTIDTVVAEGNRPGFEVGDTIQVRGSNLDGEVELRFVHRSMPEVVMKAIGGDVPGEVKATIGIDPAVWAAGTYAVDVIVRRPGAMALATNEIAMPLAPRITSVNPTSVAAGAITLTVTTEPVIRPSQRVSLLFGSQQVPAEPTAEPTGSMVFHLNANEPGTYLVRMRVDGVDSLPVDRSVQPFRFDDRQKVTVR